MDYKVSRAFERHDGKTLRKYKRGAILGPKEAAKIPQKVMSRLLSARTLIALPSQAEQRFWHDGQPIKEEVD